MGLIDTAIDALKDVVPAANGAPSRLKAEDLALIACFGGWETTLRSHLLVTLQARLPGRRHVVAEWCPTGPDKRKDEARKRADIAVFSSAATEPELIVELKHNFASQIGTEHHAVEKDLHRWVSRESPLVVIWAITDLESVVESLKNHLRRFAVSPSKRDLDEVSDQIVDSASTSLRRHVVFRGPSHLVKVSRLTAPRIDANIHFRTFVREPARTRGRTSRRSR
jgi:hypothetical protein